MAVEQCLVSGTGEAGLASWLQRIHPQAWNGSSPTRGRDALFIDLFLRQRKGFNTLYFQDIISGIHEPCEYPKIELTETKLKGIPRDENHPLWKETPAYTYGDRTWLPKNNRLQFASAITNSETVANFKISPLDKGAPLSESVEKRVTNLLKDVFVGGKKLK